jgi:steroid delta-isomerase-like uncharacterized protein
MSELNKILVRRAYEEVINRRQLQVIDELTAPNYVQHDANRPEDVNGPDGLKQYVERLRSAFPDLHVRVDDMVAEADMVAARWSAAGTHRGEFNRIPPTGKRANVSGMTIFRFEHGKFAEEWQIGDNLGLLQQLGVLPAMEPASAGRVPT